MKRLNTIFFAKLLHFFVRYDRIISLNQILLIKSGGGTGPVKPGNLFLYKVLNPDR